ncbi:L-rhamnose/proton symporter RhaT [Mucilaginibacter terrae]|uniref:L-rhamnose/proton symporter RhaT n=1 Tax=Mucilaginibacter terrae TaxID=1955052 RepID=UPI0036452D0D
MITPNPIAGTALHAIGGISASTCYLPYHQTKKWSWTSFWLVQALFAWLLIPLLLAILTVTDFIGIINRAQPLILGGTFILGACYGFGGMSFGYAIRHIGYSLTYTISIGISAILGTLVPLIIKGNLVSYFTRPGGGIVFLAMLTALLGIILCGWAGFKKERELGADKTFNMRKGLILTIIGGLLSAVFNIALEYGQPLADAAAIAGAGQFEGNAKLVVATSGCFVVNLIWFLYLGYKNKELKEMSISGGLAIRDLIRNFLWSALAGFLWCMQFFFYGLGHVKMGNFQFASWLIHMSMLIFFSYVVGLIMKEWKDVSKKASLILIIALFILCCSFVMMTYGSSMGETVSGH